jgi:nicotinamidase-related amidase
MVRGLEAGRRAALLISEMQNGITNPAYKTSPLVEQVVARALPAKINALAAGFRERGQPVIHCTVSARDGMRGWQVNCLLAALIAQNNELIHGSVHAAIHDDIVVADGDIISARHHGMTPFTGTDLAATLRAFGIDTVVLAGVSTNVALMGGSAEAVGLGFHVVLAEDCAAGGTAESHKFQVTMHLPLLASVTDSDSILRSPALAPEQL